MPIIFITGYGDVPKTVQAMKAGAVEFLTKPFNDEVLLSTVRQALERSRRAIAHDTEMQKLRDRHASLTPRERQVMDLVVSGLLNKQIARRTRHQRDHSKSAPRAGHAEDECRFSRRTGKNGSKATPLTFAECQIIKLKSAILVPGRTR